MIEYSYITGPLIGGVIGYITNALAIKMLFRPYRAKYIFGIKIPFTPGIIPKEKGRIALAIGGAISENLMNAEVLEKNLLSEDMISKIHDGIMNFFKEQKKNPETLKEFLRHYLSEKDVDFAIESIKLELTNQVSHKLEDSALGTQIADVVVDHVSSKLRIDGLDLPLGALGGIIGKISNIGGTLWNGLAEMIQPPLKNFLSKSINTMLVDKGPEIVNNLLSTEIEEFASTPMRRLLEGKDAQIQQFCGSVISVYRRLISEQLPKILSTINIPQIIESRINEMDMKETEQLIFKVMDKELKAIIWLGALLGMIMGCMNILII